MPLHNTNGGKASKRGKKRPGATAAGEYEHQQNRFNGAAEGEQDYARVLRMLGNRRVVCFCNDGKERICKIRQGICRGSSHYTRIEVGDIVLISSREFESTGTAESVSNRKEIADILDKFKRSDWRDIRKLPNIHPQLFMSEAAATGGGGGPPIDDIFEEEGAKDNTAAAANSNAGNDNVPSDSDSDSDSDADVNIDAI